MCLRSSKETSRIVDPPYLDCSPVRRKRRTRSEVDCAREGCSDTQSSPRIRRVLARQPEFLGSSDHGLEFAEVFGVKEERVILAFEAPVEAFDLRVIARPSKGVGDPHIVVREQLGRPCVARKDAVLVVMDEYVRLFVRAILHLLRLQSARFGRRSTPQLAYVQLLGLISVRPTHRPVHGSRPAKGLFV